MNEQQNEKIKKLRLKYLDSSESQSDIDALETDLTRLIEEKQMANNPIFIAIFKDAEKKLNEINALLMNDEKLSELERGKLFHERRIWNFIFKRFGLKPHDDAIALLENDIDSKLAQ